jgi:hypothetical protein
MIDQGDDPVTWDANLDPFILWLRSRENVEFLVRVEIVARDMTPEPGI